MNRTTLWLSLLVALLIASPVHAGTANQPEIRDPRNDSNPFGDAAIPSLDITKAWVQPKGDDFNFILEVASLSIPEHDHVFVFHYTWQNFRLYFRANWSAGASSFEYLGGLYEGVKGTNAFDPEGNRNYLYMPGNGSQQERLKGEIIAGAPGRIVWSYPLDSFTANRANLEFKGLFVTTYLKRADGSLQYIDTAVAESDYVHQIHTPWYAKILPAPGAGLIALVGVALVGLLAHRARRGT